MGIVPSDLAGLILTGGRSERMGEDKATLEIAGRSMWEIAASIVEPLVDAVVFVGAVGAWNPPAPYRLLRDDPPGNGPLGGIVTGLEQSGYTHHLILAVDYPFVRANLLKLFLAKANGVHAICGRSASFLEPLVAYYHRDCAPTIRGMLAEGEVRTHKLFERVPSVVIEEQEYDRVDPRRVSQINVNSTEERERAEALLQEQKT